MKRRLRLVGPRRQLHNRHYCTICGNRVFPSDSFERDTEAPQPGVSGNRILLASANAARGRNDDPSRIAWCFVDKRWVETERLTHADIVQRYLNRRGVEIRYRKGGGAILRLRQRRSA